jgi:hypothetical protein
MLFRNNNFHFIKNFGFFRFPHSRLNSPSRIVCEIPGRTQNIHSSAPLIHVLCSMFIVKGIRIT